MARKKALAGWGPLTGRIALVAGATRGAGRGVARALGEAGATVYCTGRSVTGTASPYGRPETIDETAAISADLQVAWLTSLVARTKKFRVKIPGATSSRGQRTR